MKVKVIEIGREDLRHTPEPEAVENALQTWLDDNPDASIEHVTQAPVSSEGYGITNRLLVTIFYHD
jgi:hypothetical protein